MWRDVEGSQFPRDFPDGVIFTSRGDLCSRQQRRPCWIGCKPRRRNLEFVAARNIHGEQIGTLAEIAEEHHHATVRRKRRAFIMEARGEDALARSVRLHDADSELAAALHGEGDVVAARRPYRRRIAAVAERDALRGTTARCHYINLRLAA